MMGILHHYLLNFQAPKLYNELCKAFKTADVVLPRVKYRKHVKPYWNKALNDLKKVVLPARLEWIRRGSPRDPENLYYRQYKKVKCNYRREQRKAVGESERKELDEIAHSNEISHAKFWRLVTSRARKKVTKAK